MPIKNTLHAYGIISKIFHWSSSMLILALLIVGFLMVGFEEPLKSSIYMAHKSTGMLLLFWLLARLMWRLANPVPEQLPKTCPWEKGMARYGHPLLYGLIILMPLSGWIKSTASGYPPTLYGYGTFPFPFVETSELLTSIGVYLHRYTAWVLVILILLHIGVAIKHHAVNKNYILKRMLP